MSLNGKTGQIFRPWDVTCDGETSPIHHHHHEVSVKCDLRNDDEGSTSPSSSSGSASGCGSTATVDSTGSQDTEDDSLLKLTSLVDRTILSIPGNDDSVDGSSSDNGFVTGTSSVDEDGSPQRSAFVPAHLANCPTGSFGFPSGSNPALTHQELIAWQERAAAFDRLAHQGHFALEEAARMLQHHEALVKQSKKLRPKKFRCPHCDVAFSNNGQLKGHIRIHTGERPFKCDEEGCGKTFTRNEELTRHKRIHSGVRPHSCPSCGKRFGRKDHLKKHARTHEMRGPTIYIPAPGPFPFPAEPPLHSFFFRL